MGELHIPGLVAAAVDSGRVVWVRAYGLANVGSSEPATDTTPFMIASVSKTITASVIMSLHADGRFKLDDDVNEYLPFPVRNPNHPASPITFRHLLRHRSSIADNGDFYAPFWGEATGDPTTTLGSYLRDYLTPTGASYDREKNFLETAPDERESYCNTCYALIGFLAAEISGLPFERLSDEVLFTPLEMTRTAWFLRDFAGTGLAMPYRFVADSGYVAYGQNGYPDWPAGQLRTTITDFARFLSVYADGGDFNGQTVIDSNSGPFRRTRRTRRGCPVEPARFSSKRSSSTRIIGMKSIPWRISTRRKCCSTGSPLTLPLATAGSSIAASDRHSHQFSTEDPLTPVAAND